MVRAVLFTAAFQTLNALHTLPAHFLFGTRGRDCADEILIWIHRWARHVIFATRLSGLRYDLDGLEHVSALEGPAIIAPGHRSMLEIFVILALIPNTSFVIANWVGSIWMLGPLLRRAGFFVLPKRPSGKTRLKLCRWARRQIKKGRKIVIFPEGKIVRPGEVASIKTGVWNLYRSLKCPVVPVFVEVGDCWPWDARLDRVIRIAPGAVVLRFMGPLAYDPELPRETFIEFLRTSIYQQSIDPR